jgi:hypothetical protein
LELLAVCIDSATLSTQINSDGREIIKINKKSSHLDFNPRNRIKFKKTISDGAQQ